MDEIDKEYQDSLNPDGSGEPKTDEGLTGEDNPLETQSEEQLAADNLKLRETNAKLYARAKKAEEALKGRKDSENKTEPQDDSSWKAKMEFVLKHNTLDEDQIEYISIFAKGKGVSLDEAFKNPLVKATVEEDQRAKRIANATPEGKSQSPQYKDLQQQINEAPDRETHKKLFEQARKEGTIKGVQTE